MDVSLCQRFLCGHLAGSLHYKSLHALTVSCVFWLPRPYIYIALAKPTFPPQKKALKKEKEKNCLAFTFCVHCKGKKELHLFKEQKKYVQRDRRRSAMCLNCILHTQFFSLLISSTNMAKPFNLCLETVSRQWHSPIATFVTERCDWKTLLPCFAECRRFRLSVIFVFGIYLNPH